MDEHGQIIDVLLREHRDTASAEAFFAQALGRSGQPPSAIVTDQGRSSGPYPPRFIFGAGSID